MRDDCIDHERKGNSNGYHTVWDSNRLMQCGAHVLTLIRKTGEHPNGREAMHLCDNSRCINPDHLQWGSRADNRQDAISKGRFKNQQLSADQAKEIKARLKLGERHKDLIEEYQVSKHVIYNLSAGRTWKNA